MVDERKPGDAAEQATSLTKRLRYINPGAPIWRAAEDDLDADALLSAHDHKAWQLTDSNDAVPDGHHHQHAENIRTLALSIETPIDWTRFGIWLTMLLHRHGDALLRIKASSTSPTRQRRWQCMPCSIWCIRRGTWRHGQMGTDAPAWSSSSAGWVRE